VKIGAAILGRRGLARYGLQSKDSMATSIGQFVMAQATTVAAAIRLLKYEVGDQGLALKKVDWK
jgi:hypothetical protein